MVQDGSGLVLVTGAAGGVMGGTGRILAEKLLKQGVPVRALVRTDDDRATALRAAGAEVLFLCMGPSCLLWTAGLPLDDCSSCLRDPFSLCRCMAQFCGQQAAP